MFHANGNQKKARVAIFISEKTDFKNKKYYERILQEEDYYMMLQEYFKKDAT